MQQAPPRKRIMQLGFITIGLPFAVFKVTFGATLPQLVPGYGGLLGGAALITLGVADLAVNLLNSIALVARGRAFTQVCMLAILLHRLGGTRAQHSRVFSADFGTALDVMLSFSLVALVVGLGLMPHFGETERRLWNLCVVTNVLGAGISRILATVSPSGENNAG